MGSHLQYTFLSQVAGRRFTERLNTLLIAISHDSLENLNLPMYLELIESAASLHTLTYTQCFKQKDLLKFLNQVNIYSVKYPLKFGKDENNSLYRFVCFLIMIKNG